MATDRFSDDTLKRAMEARLEAELDLLGDPGEIIAENRTPEVEAAGYAAMRAVLEGHLLERKEIPIRFKWRDAETDGPDGAGAQVVVAYPNPNHPDGWNLRVQWTPLRAELAPMPALWRPLDWPAPPVEASDGSLS